MSQPHKFYVYVLSRPDGSVFYVGKGTGRRIDAHELEARKGHICPKCSIIRKIWREGGTVIKRKVFTTDDETEALDREVALIAEYGRVALANLTDGGTGISGATLVFSDEHRERLRIAQTGKTYSAEAKAKIGAASRGRVQSAEARAKKREANRRLGINPPSTKGTVLSPEHRAKLSAARKRYVASPEVRAKLSAMYKGRPATAQAVAVSRRLTMEQAREIRATYASRLHSQDELARMYGVDPSTISRIVTGKSYRDDRE